MTTQQSGPVLYKNHPRRERRIALAMAFCAAAILPAGAASTAQPPAAPAAVAKDLCHQGRSQYASGDVLKAIQTLGKCLEHEPRNREALTALGNASMEAGRFPEAVGAFARAQALKPGDATFLASYLAALDGAGKIDEQVPVYAALAEKKPGVRKIAESYLAAVEAAGPEKHPEEYLSALQALGEFPDANAIHLEKLASAYLGLGAADKAEAEYRGLLEKKPESPDYWAGLGASQAKSDPEAAAECYRKAALYTDQASQRQIFQSEGQRLAQVAKAGSPPTAFPAPVPSNIQVSQKPAVKSVPPAATIAVAEPPVPAPVAPAPVAVAKPPAPATPAPIVPAAKPAPAPMAAVKAPVPAAPIASSTPVAAGKPAPKPFNLKAFQDSVYKAELEKQMAAIRKANPPASPSPVVPASAPAPVPAVAAIPPSVTPSAAPAPSAPIANAKEKEAREKEAKDKERKDAEDKRITSEKAQKEKLAKEAEQKAAVEKEKQERLAKQAADEKLKQEKQAADEKLKQEQQAKLAADTKARQEKLAADEKLKQEKLSAEKAKQDKLAADEKAKLEKLAREEQERKEKVQREAERVAKEERERLAREAEAKRLQEEKARKLKEDQDRREKLAKERHDRYDHALAFYNTGHMDSASILFKTVLQDSPSTDAFYHAGRVSLARNEYAQALDRFGKGPQDKADLDGLKGKAYLGLGKTKDAQKFLEAQYAKSKNDSLLEDLVALKKKNGDEAGAMAYLEKLAEKKPDIEKLQMELAGYYLKQGDKAKASARFAKALALNPNNPEANAYLGMEGSAKGDQAHAVPLLDKAVAAYPKRPDIWKALAQGDASLGRKDAAWEAYKKAFALAPDDLDLAKGKLNLALEPGRTAEAPQAYADVLRIAPQDKEANMGLGKLRFKEGNYPAAEKYFRVACSDTKDAQALAQFGRTLLELKKIDEAAIAIQKAVDMGDKEEALRYDLARIHMEKGDLDWAEGLVKDLAKKSATDPEPLYWQGQIALKRQQTAVAEEFFRKANRLKPADGRYAEALARLGKEKEEYQSSAAVLRLAESDLKESGRLLYGDCLAQGGEYPKAMEVYAAMYKRSASAQLLSRQMDLLVRSGKAEQAVELAAGNPFSESVEVEYSLAKAQLALADAHIIKGDVDQAVDLMKKVVKSNDRNAEYHYYLGLGYFGQNRLKKARDEFIDAITYRVDYPEALYHKGLCQIKLDDIKDAENSFGELSQHADPVWKAHGLYGLALVFEAQGKPEAVEHHLERSILASPLPEAMAYLSRIRLKQGRVVEAEESAKKALMADPSHEEGTVALAEALAAAKRQSEAMELAKQGLRAKPLSCGLLVQSAKLTFESGKLDSALAVSSNAIRICPEEPMGYYYAGVSTHGTNRPKEAKQYFKSFTKLGGDKKLVPEP